MAHIRAGGVCRAIVFLLLGCLLRGEAMGCPYLVRDVGFSSWRGGKYRLCLFLKDDSADGRRLAESFQAIANEVFAESNVRPEVVSPDKRESHEAWGGIPTIGGARLPAAVLLSPDGRTLVLPAIIPALSSTDRLRAELTKIVSSPATEDIRAHGISHWCVVLLVPGPNENENAKARTEIEKAGERIVGAAVDMGRTVDQGPYLIEAPNKDRAEDLLLWSYALQEDAARPRAVVLYGRGVQIGPILEGDGIARDALLPLFQALGRNCSCAMDPALWLGPAAPMAWGEAFQTKVRETYGFDPDSPQFRYSVADYVPGAGKTAAAPGGIGYSEGYVEFTDDPSPKGGPAKPKISQKSSSAVAPPASRLERRTGAVMIYAVCGMGVLVGAAGVFWIVRKRRVS